MRAFWASVALALILSFPALSHAQGCSLCRDTTAGSAAQARQGLRRAILVLGIPAGAVFVTVLLVARRMRPREEDESAAVR